MFDALKSLLDDGTFPAVERFVLPGRPACYSPIPRFLRDSRVGWHLNRDFMETNGKLWSHQAKALEALGRGENLVVSTGTASGKSLIFRSLAFHKALLQPSSRTLVFYPLKALAADQMRGWQEMADDLELPKHTVGRIDGSVPVQEREEILNNAQIVIMTPDACHAWLMYRLALPSVREFLRSLSTLIMDEAHTLEGVFGSNFAFLIRRLMAARVHLVSDAVRNPLQLVAATATIRDPGEHMKHLTGENFTVIDHEEDGSPQHDRLVAHIVCPDGEAVNIAKELQTSLLQDGRRGAFITFLDSRKGVEALAMTHNPAQPLDIATADVLPYRAGYDAEDRAAIEVRLRQGNLKGVVTTSALELGIDIHHLQVGINVGVPSTRKSYRQRLGRVGRDSEGAFLVVAPQQAFSSFGSSFQEYHEMSVEPSHLYLDNRFMQFAHGRCLANEQESLDAPPGTPRLIAWPHGFAEMHSAARPGGIWPTEFDAIAALGGDNPHHGYPLRNIGELNYQIKRHQDADSIGEVNQVQALRECYPGGTYLHLTNAYEVKAWSTGIFNAYIRVANAPSGRRTKPRIVTWVNTSMGSNGVQEGNLLRGENGLLAESLMQVTQRVEGYVDERSGEYHDYKELQQRDPNMRARLRNFRTTGVVLCINHDWFKRGTLRRSFVNKLRDIFVREYSVAPQDVAVAWSNISIQIQGSGGVHGGCVVVFDETYGSLRLTEHLYDKFSHLLDRIASAAKADNDLQMEQLVRQVQAEVGSFTGDMLQEELQNAPTGYEQVFTRGSIVCYRQAGAMAVDVEIIQPTIMQSQLMYQIKVQQNPQQMPVLRWVAASAVEPSANADVWEYAWWNRETQDYEDPQHLDQD